MKIKPGIVQSFKKTELDPLISPFATITGEFDFSVANFQASDSLTQPSEQMMMEEDFKNLNSKSIIR